MISSRFLLAATTALFFLVLGVFALIKRPRTRLSVLFALYSLVSVPVIFPAAIYLSELLGHQGALFIYRLLQLGHPLGVFFLMCFVQDFSGVYERPVAVALRRLGGLMLVLVLPFYFTGLIIRDFQIINTATDVLFIRQPGSLFGLHQLLFLIFFISGLVTSFRSLMGSQGIKQNQRRFIALGLILGLLAVVFNYLSYKVVDWPFVYFPLYMGMSFCFAFAIFRYGLFEFNLWMRRVSIYAGVYALLGSIPFFVFFPFRFMLPVGTSQFWIVMCLMVLLYGILFSTAPAITTFIRIQAEKKRWENLQQQLDLVQKAAQRLADESSLSVDDTVKRIAHVLSDFYSNELKTPLQFVMAVAVDPKGKLAYSILPPLEAEPTIVGAFMESLRALPIHLLETPFSQADVQRRFRSSGTSPSQEVIDTVEQYLEQNGIEYCCPCINDNKILGALLLGPKTSGIFFREELTTIQMAAGHMAIAIRKSELLELNKALKDLDGLKNDLISNITHEFKSPLANVENAVDILIRETAKTDLDKEKAAKYLLMIRNNAERLGIFIQSLLDVAKIEQSKVQLKSTWTDLNALINEAINIFQPMADKKRVQLLFQHPESLQLKIDPEKISQVIFNLISNALKFTENGSVRISTEKIVDHVSIVVSDTGQGIEASYLQSIFEKFFQAPSSTSGSIKGTGLGLAIAKGWVEAHGGRIWVESAGKQKGSTFYVELPV